MIIHHQQNIINEDKTNHIIIQKNNDHREIYLEIQTIFSNIED